jgi:hypothetical protein
VCDGHCPNARAVAGQDVPLAELRLGAADDERGFSFGEQTIGNHSRYHDDWHRIGTFLQAGYSSGPGMRWRGAILNPDELDFQAPQMLWTCVFRFSALKCLAQL